MQSNSQINTQNFTLLRGWVKTPTFEWDAEKNASNQQKHNISFETAQYVFLDPQAKRKPDRVINSEQSEHIIGTILDVVVVLVVFTERNGNIRIISARRANKKERILYNGHQ
jgi:uncharacterized DUF497 family protein